MDIRSLVAYTFIQIARIQVSKPVVRFTAAVLIGSGAVLVTAPAILIVFFESFYPGRALSVGPVDAAADLSALGLQNQLVLSFILFRLVINRWAVQIFSKLRVLLERMLCQTHESVAHSLEHNFIFEVTPLVQRRKLLKSSTRIFQHVVLIQQCDITVDCLVLV